MGFNKNQKVGIALCCTIVLLPVGAVVYYQGHKKKTKELFRAHNTGTVHETTRNPYNRQVSFSNATDTIPVASEIFEPYVFTSSQNDFVPYHMSHVAPISSYPAASYCSPSSYCSSGGW